MLALVITGLGFKGVCSRGFKIYKGKESLICVGFLGFSLALNWTTLLFKYVRMRPEAMSFVMTAWFLAAFEKYENWFSYDSGAMNTAGFTGRDEDDEQEVDPRGTVRRMDPFNEELHNSIRRDVSNFFQPEETEEDTGESWFD